MQLTNIGWCDCTWNPVTGCLHNCSYCYARKLAETRLRGRCGYPEVDPFAPTFHPNRLNDPLTVKKPSMIFVGSMGDLFGEWVFKKIPQGYCEACGGSGSEPYQISDDKFVECPCVRCRGEGVKIYNRKWWIDRILEVVKQCPQHIFIFLTKNPKRYSDFKFQRNCWLGTSLEKHSERKGEFLKAVKLRLNIKFISWEPITGDLQEVGGIDWLIMGAMTGAGAKKYEPKPEWIKDAVKACRKYDIPIFMKSSLKKICEINKIDFVQEWPNEKD